MADQDYALLMARYNAWQNDSLMAAADGLSEDERQRDRGAFFRSIAGTLSHLYWGDRTWMSRFAGTEPPGCGIPDSAAMFGDWDSYCLARRQFDQRILDWAHEVAPDWFAGDLTWYSGAAGREVTKPRSILIVHLFNHQTHHRGQVHAMLTAAGARPDDTDLFLMPERYRAM